MRRLRAWMRAWVVRLIFGDHDPDAMLAGLHQVLRYARRDREAQRREVEQLSEQVEALQLQVAKLSISRGELGEVWDGLNSVQENLLRLTLHVSRHLIEHSGDDVGEISIPIVVPTDEERQRLAAHRARRGRKGGGR